MKAILVVDNPNNCYECPCYKKGQTRYECGAYLFNNNRILIIDDLSNKPNDCPLKPMPEEMKKGFTKDFMLGWNSCREVIIEGWTQEYEHTT